MKTASFYKNAAVLSVTGITLGLGRDSVGAGENLAPSLRSGMTNYVLVSAMFENGLNLCGLNLCRSAYSV